MSPDVLFSLTLLCQIGPKGLEFGRYSLDYHTIRNYLHVHRYWGKQRYKVFLLINRGAKMLHYIISVFSHLLKK